MEPGIGDKDQSAAHQSEYAKKNCHPRSKFNYEGKDQQDGRIKSAAPSQILQKGKQNLPTSVTFQRKA
jgi:hypothetical protein